MAGNFVSMNKNTHANPPVWVAWTHGCDCCASYVEIGPGDVRTHIQQLYKDIAEANGVLKDMGEEPERAPEGGCGSGGIPQGGRAALQHGRSRGRSGNGPAGHEPEADWNDQLHGL